MIFDLEALGGDAMDAMHAAINLKDATALAAMKVVVMASVGGLVAGGVPGDFDRCHLALCAQILDRAVDCGDAQAGKLDLGKFQQFLGRDRTAGALEGDLNRLALPRGAFLGHVRVLGLAGGGTSQVPDGADERLGAVGQLLRGGVASNGDAYERAGEVVITA